MRTIELAVFPLARTAPDHEVIEDWLDHIGVEDSHTIVEESRRIPDPDALVALGGKRCYMSFEVGLNPNVKKIREDWGEYLTNILASKHGSVLEHVSWTFAIEGVSRVFTGEMNRHRAGVAISEGSMRYIRYEDIPFWMPFILRQKDPEETIDGDLSAIDRLEDHEIASLDPEYKKAWTREIFFQAFRRMEEEQALLARIWKKELNSTGTGTFTLKKQLTSAFRRIIGMGIATGGIWTMNLRALRHIITMRCEEAAEEEICAVVGMIAKHMVEHETGLLDDFTQDGPFWRPGYEKV